jgi:hypothetical protein
MIFKAMTIFVALIAYLFIPQTIFAQEKHDMKMQGGHSQMMSHPEKMDEQMMVHHEHVKTMERVFRYERNLAGNANAIKVGYLYKLGDAAAERDKDVMVMMSKTMVEGGLSGKEVSFDPIGINPGSNLSSQLSEAGVNVIYIGSGLSAEELNGAKKFAVEKKMLTIGNTIEQAENGITAVGIVVNKDKVDLIINLKTADELAADFDPRLYRLADKVIK